MPQRRIFRQARKLRQLIGAQIQNPQIRQRGDLPGIGNLVVSEAEDRQCPGKGGQLGNPVSVQNQAVQTGKISQSRNRRNAVIRKIQIFQCIQVRKSGHRGNRIVAGIQFHQAAQPADSGQTGEAVAADVQIKQVLAAPKGGEGAQIVA